MTCGGRTAESSGEEWVVKKRAYEIARELGVPLRDVRTVMVDLGLYLSAATPLTEEQTHGIVSRIQTGPPERPANEDPSGTDY